MRNEIEPILSTFQFSQSGHNKQMPSLYLKFPAEMQIQTDERL
jgi:hypothetical protein